MYTTESIKTLEIKKPVKIPDSCPECGKPLKRSLGKYGPFLSCSGYPDCSYGYNITNHTRVSCPECRNILMVRKAKNNNFLFLGCSNYPTCNYTINFSRGSVSCTECGTKLAIYDSRFGKYVGCKNFSECNFKIYVRSPKLGLLLNLEIIGEQKFHDHTTASFEKENTIESNKNFEEIQEKLNLQQIGLQEVYELCKKAYERGLKMDINTLYLASLYTLTKVKGIYVDLGKFAQFSGINEKILLKKYKKLRKDVLPFLDYKIIRQSINDYIEIFSSKLDINEDIRKISHKIIELAKDEGYSSVGKDPKGVAAAAIYISANAKKRRITQAKIAAVAAITEVTLRTRNNELNRFISLCLLRGI
ncbi:MAG: topoisomerase DNA-binding C4 zinc finger domain-containing protein [Promethearchaeota archaeon]|jgi:ssDNA-binding Zn-finger/Zn-ribbon topoisomerase 1